MFRRRVSARPARPHSRSSRRARRFRALARHLGHRAGVRILGDEVRRDREEGRHRAVAVDVRVGRLPASARASFRRSHSESLAPGGVTEREPMVLARLVTARAEHALMRERRHVELSVLPPRWRPVPVRVVAGRCLSTRASRQGKGARDSGREYEQTFHDSSSRPVTFLDEYERKRSSDSWPLPPRLPDTAWSSGVWVVPASCGGPARRPAVIACGAAVWRATLEFTLRAGVQTGPDGPA
jgi:hypothetical protein